MTVQWVRVVSWSPDRKTITGKKPGHYSFSWHKVECFVHMRRKLARWRRWIKKYPNYCRTCGGSGTVFWTENQSPLGSGHYWPMHMSDSCLCIVPDDIEEMVCPRCGERIYRAIVVKHAPQDETLWLRDEYGHDGIVESWLEEMGKCPLCGWMHGKAKDDAIPDLEWDCGCWLDDSKPYVCAKPYGLQLSMFRLFGQTGQVFFKYPIMILESKREYEKATGRKH